MNFRIVGSVLRQLGPHLFSTVAISCFATIGGMVHLLLVESVGMRAMSVTWQALFVRQWMVVRQWRSGGTADYSVGGKKAALVSY
ncbi:putative ubiquinol oxidase 2, mitochondrial [Cocos nucifera]|nr:putative ubiquinol oxidase 2, mitochondrial [Cocos nucifera]